jgi:hypothetical protein
LKNAYNAPVRVRTCTHMHAPHKQLHVHTHIHTQRKGFMTYERKPMPYRPTEERVTDWKEVHAKISPDKRGELLHTQVRHARVCVSTCVCQNLT